MKILLLSTRSRYGLKAMFDLAMNYGCGPKTLKQIASRQKLPEQYLEQILISLRKAGLIKGVRGAQGGYILTRAPQDITVGNIIRVLENSIATVGCVQGDGEDVCEDIGFCPSRSVWMQIEKSINDTMDAISLSDMINDYKGLCQSTNPLKEYGEKKNG